MKLSLFSILTISSAIEMIAAEQAPSFKEDDPFRLEVNPYSQEEKLFSEEQTFVSGPLLKINDKNIIVNQKILDNNLFKDCLQLVEYMYFGTKRYASTKRIYEDAFRKQGANKPALYSTIKKKNINIETSFFGTNGMKEGADIGLIAYRKLEEKKLLQLFIILEGSQGEDFEFLGGLGGASWLTNFQAKKVKIDAKEEFQLNEKYLLEGDGVLSFHEGYLAKIANSNYFFRNAIVSVLNDTLHIKDISKNSESKTKSMIDKERGFTVQVYILGHSQGGGLVQVAAPYYTNYIGQYLYGQNFDNKEFNTVHAICLSPARAIGDNYTLNVIERVMGQGNIFGYCSPMDPVPCVPLGSNIDGHKLAKISFKIKQGLLKLISHFVSKELSPLLEALSTVDCNYVDLPIFAYEDYNDLLSRYAQLSIDALKKARKSGIESLEKILKNRDSLKEHLKETQENYFESHRHSILKKDYYLVKSAYHLKEVFEKCSAVDYIAAQHFGTKTYLTWGDHQGNKQGTICALFNHKILEGDVQKAIDRGIEYKRHKEEFLK